MKNWLRLEIDCTWKGENRRNALRYALEAVNGLQEAKENSATVERLLDAYFAQAKRYREASARGNMRDIASEGEKFELLAGIMGIPRRKRKWSAGSRRG